MSITQFGSLCPAQLIVQIRLIFDASRFIVYLFEPQSSYTVVALQCCLACCCSFQFSNQKHSLRSFSFIGDNLGIRTPTGHQILHFCFEFSFKLKLIYCEFNSICHQFLSISNYSHTD